MELETLQADKPWKASRRKGRKLRYSGLSHDGIRTVVHAASREEADAMMHAKEEKARAKRRKLEAVAALPDLPEPRSISLESPQVVRGFGGLWLAVAFQPGTGETVTRHHEWGPTKERLPALIVLEWFNNQDDAEAFIVKHFGKPRRTFYSKAREADFDLYIRNRRKTA